ncbi:MAG TPA: hypothetical protein VFI35_06915 [Actinomycetota bacterium]|nr:hypothetical protein [Actinomycetota bacterium]
MRSVSLSVDSRPPTRHDPGRCADRTSPNALPLFRATAAVVAEEPDAFPIRGGVRIVVTSSEPLPEPSGYGPADAMIEVLIDAGLLADERLVERERYNVRPETTGYSISVEPANL